jgi:hypothetical protein
MSKLQTKRVVSWKTQVQTDATGNWYGSDLRFPTKQQAEGYVHDLMMRWMQVNETRVKAVHLPATHVWDSATRTLTNIEAGVSRQPPVSVRVGS